MRSRWSRARAQRLRPLEALVYRSRLIGQQPTLGLFGGGNTSLKCAEPDLVGRPQDVLWVKGSGADLAACEPKHFAPLPLAPLRTLAARRAMSDEDMVAFLERCLLDPKAPRPSIETLLHAFLPEPAVDHTHADAILAIANTDRGHALIRRLYGDTLLWIPYLQPGFALSRRVFEAYQDHPRTIGAVLQHHGLITWGPDGRTSYRRTVEAVSRAEQFLARAQARRRWSASAHRTLPEAERTARLRRWLPVIRRTLSVRRKVCLRVADTPDVLEFVNAARMPSLARVGPATPDHMLRTKRLPCLLAPALAPAGVARRLERYAADHARYVRAHARSGQRSPAGRSPERVPPKAGRVEGAVQDPFPRVILIPGVGMVTSGKDATEAAMVTELYRHAMAVMRQASTVGRYTSVSAREAFAVEYWPLELYKLSLAPPEAELARQVGLITGAAGGIGRAIAGRLVDAGMSVVVTDLDRAAVERLADALNRRAGRRRALGLAMDVTDERGIERAFDAALRVFGGLDVLVSNAGIAHVAGIERLELAEWERSLAVNATGHFLVSRAAVRLLRAQGLGGAIIVIATKNVLAPGKDFGAYSAAKAAAVQLARILAIENGECGIRVNIVNPDGVFDGSGLWRAIGPDRARTYRLRPGQLQAYYQQRNLLRARVLPEDVAEAVAFFASRRSAKTTGCILTVDGGLREAFPR